MNETDLEQTLAQLGDGHESVVGDVSEESTAEQLAETAQSAFGRIDVLVNNAGVHFIRDILETTSENWDRVMGINLKSMFLCAKPLMVGTLPVKMGRNAKRGQTEVGSAPAERSTVYLEAKSSSV